MIASNPQAREIKEHLGRAKSLFNRHEVLRGIVTALEGMKLYFSGRFYGSQKIEIEYMFAEIVQMFTTFNEVKGFLPPGFSYEKGKEREIYQQLIKIIQDMAKSIEEQEAENDSDSEELRRRRLLEKMQACLQSKDKVKAASHMKALVDAYGEDPEVFNDIAEGLYQSGNLDQALVFAEKALAKDKKNQTAYRIIVNVHRHRGDYKKAEQTYRQALKAFGEHANIFLNLHRLYKEWGKPDKAEAAANKALELDPDNEEVREFLDGLKQEKGSGG
ncbi:MAG: tetratricopeptide repeat protein [Desulfonatronovibrionaceae bacterium]